MIQCGRALIKSPRVRRLGKPHQFPIEVMAKLVAERREECPERGDPFLDRRPHPHANQLLFEMVVPKKLGSQAVLPDFERTRPKHPNVRRRDAIVAGRRTKELKTCLPHRWRLLRAERLLDGTGRRAEAIVGGQFHTGELVAPQVLGPKPIRFRKTVRDHRVWPIPSVHPMAHTSTLSADDIMAAILHATR
jgi:hypothetical protein